MLYTYKKPGGISEKTTQRRTDMNKLNDEAMETVNGGGGIFDPALHSIADAIDWSVFDPAINAVNSFRYSQRLILLFSDHFDSL